MPTRREMLNAAAALAGASVFGVPASRAATQAEDAIREKTRGAPRMTWFPNRLCAAGLLAMLVAPLRIAAHAGEIPRAPVSGSAFLSPEPKALEADEFANAGVLWIVAGERLWG